MKDMERLFATKIRKEMLIDMTDWNQIWKDALLASRLTDDNYYDQEERAESYDKSENIRTDGERRVTLLDPDPSWSVLDIGAGPGTLAIPLARRVRRVTAVEPSRPMIRCLEKHLAEGQLCNVRIINSRWEDVSLEEAGRHELVIASYSLNFEDIGEALRKMNRLASQRVCLYWFAGVTSWEEVRMDLFPPIYERKYSPYPKINIIYNLLYDWGLYPDVEVLQQTAFPRNFADYHEALSYLKSTLNIAGRDHETLLHNYIEDRWRQEDGSLFMEDGTVYVKLSWRPKMSAKVSG
jgi:ubiquinone/menaquinone biosynthesis C-methylase UbiE